MFAVDVCELPATGGSTFVVVAGLFVLVAGVIVTRWVRQSAGRLSIVVAPLVLLGGFVLAPQVSDPCAPSATTTVAPTTTTTTTTTVAPALYNVGAEGPGGGIIFYVDMTRAAGSQYWEAAFAGWQNNCDGTTVDPLAEWGCYGTAITGADGKAIGTGEQNTTDIVDLVTGCTDAGIAAKLAADYSHNTLDDWFLPSKDELNQMYIQQTAIGGFSTFFYWSSSETVDANGAWSQSFYYGYGAQASKYNTFHVRPVRAF